MKPIRALVLVLGLAIPLAASARAGADPATQELGAAVQALAQEMAALPAEGLMCPPRRSACAPSRTGGLIPAAEEGEDGEDDYDACVDQCQTVHVKCKRDCTWRHCIELCDSKYYECRDKCGEAGD